MSLPLIWPGVEGNGPLHAMFAEAMALTNCDRRRFYHKDGLGWFSIVVSPTYGWRGSNALTAKTEEAGQKWLKRSTPLQFRWTSIRRYTGLFYASCKCHYQLHSEVNATEAPFNNLTALFPTKIVVVDPIGLLLLAKGAGWFASGDCRSLHKVMLNFGAAHVYCGQRNITAMCQVDNEE